MQDVRNAPAAVACLNEMVTDALQHVPHCFKYLARVRDRHIFRFCAIPQVCSLLRCSGRNSTPPSSRTFLPRSPTQAICGPS